MPSKKIYLVGGAVRDMLMERDVTDKDYAAVGYLLSEFSHLKQVSKNFPVFLQSDGSELALARLEWKKDKGYNSFEVETAGVTFEDDLKHRDLTINSIAYDKESGKYIDPFGGQEDTATHIRCVR